MTSSIVKPGIHSFLSKSVFFTLVLLLLYAAGGFDVLYDFGGNVVPCLFEQYGLVIASVSGMSEKKTKSRLYLELKTRYPTIWVKIRDFH